MNLTEETKGKLENYGTQIVSLRAKNDALNEENKKLAKKYDSLTNYNQVLGDDLANTSEALSRAKSENDAKRQKLRQINKQKNGIETKVRQKMNKLTSHKDFAFACRCLTELKEEKSQNMKNFFILAELQKMKLNSSETKERVLRVNDDIEEENEEIESQISNMKNVIEQDDLSLSEKRKILEEIIEQIKARNEKKQLMNEENEKLKVELINRIGQIKNNSDESASDDENDFADDEDETKIMKNDDDYEEEEESSGIVGKKSVLTHLETNKEKEENVERKETKDDEIKNNESKVKEEVKKVKEVVKEPIKGQGKSTKKDDKEEEIKEKIEEESENSEISGKEEKTKTKNIKSKVNNESVVIRKIDNKDDDEYEYYSIDEESSIKASKEDKETQFEINEYNLINEKIDDYGQVEDEHLDEIIVPIEPPIEKEKQEQIDELEKQVNEKKRIKIELENKKPKEVKLETEKSICASISPAPDPITELALRKFDTIEMSTQTDVIGASFDFHEEIIKKQAADISRAEAINKEFEAQTLIVTKYEEDIAKAKFRGNQLDTEINKAKNDIKAMQANAVSTAVSQRSEEKEREMLHDKAKKLKLQLKKRQGVFTNIQNKIAEMEQKIDDLIEERTVLERDLKDLDSRNKPEVVQLSKEVTVYRGRLEEAEAKMNTMRESVNSRKERIKAINTSQRSESIRDLNFLKFSLERKQQKWNIMMRSSANAMQVIETYSFKNKQKRKQLLAQLAKLKKRQVTQDEVEKELEWYSDLLGNLILEHNTNWRKL